MLLADIFQNGLNIITRFRNPETRYDHKEISANKLAKLTGIHRTTIIKWCKNGHVKYRKARCKTNEYCYVIDWLSFINYVMQKYRYKMSSKNGRWWKPEDIDNPFERSKNAIKIKKHRLNKLKN